MTEKKIIEIIKRLGGKIEKGSLLVVFPKLSIKTKNEALDILDLRDMEMIWEMINQHTQ